MSAQDIKIVKEFNSWRRGGDDVHADDKAYPKRLGDALDSVVAMAERTEEMDRERASLLGEIDRLRQSEREGWRYADELEQERKRLHSAIKQTLDENGHLADGENCTLIVLKRALGIGSCKRCGADMQPGVAMGQTLTGTHDFIGGEVCTVSPGGPGKLIECSKCPECGWSVTA